MVSETEQARQLQISIRKLLLVFIAGLVLSGLTAFPIETLLSMVTNSLQTTFGESTLYEWLAFVTQGVTETSVKYPFIGYGTDWLAYAHLVIAIAFIGPLRDPVRNVWVIEFGMIACIGIFPVAFIGGAVREIPFFWQLIDCSFGVVGGLILLVVHKRIHSLEKIESALLLISSRGKAS